MGAVLGAAMGRHPLARLHPEFALHAESRRRRKPRRTRRWEVSVRKEAQMRTHLCIEVFCVTDKAASVLAL